MSAQQQASDSLTVFANASRGNAEGYLALADLAVEAVGTGELGKGEALIHATFWARLVVAIESSPSNLAYLGELLVAQAEYERDHGDIDHACWLGAQSLRRFREAASHNVETYVERLKALEDEIPAECVDLASAWANPTTAAEFDNQEVLLRAAATGDTAAIGMLFDDALAAAQSGVLNERGAIMLLEAIGKLGAATDEPQLAARYAGALIMRSEYDRTYIGHPERCWQPAARALHILAKLTAEAEPGAARYLEQVLGFVDPRASIAVARTDPSILASFQCQGAC